MAGFKAKRGTENRSLDPCKINHLTRMECDNVRYHRQDLCYLGATSNSSLPTLRTTTRAGPMRAPVAGSSPGASIAALRQRPRTRRRDSAAGSAGPGAARSWPPPFGCRRVPARTTRGSALSPGLVSVRGCGGDSERRPTWRCGVDGGGRRINRLGGSCEASTIARRGPDDRGEIGAVRVAGEGR
jgi:hypothetical protein